MKQAYIIYELLIGIIVLAMILSLYLPGMYHIHQQYYQQEIDLENYRFFKEMAEINWQEDQSIEEHIRDFEQRTKRQVEGFHCDPYLCEIFIDGEEYRVERKES